MPLHRAASQGPDRWRLCLQAPTCLHPFTCPYGTYARGQSHQLLTCSYNTDARGQSHYPLACSYSTDAAPRRRQGPQPSPSPPRSAALPVTLAAATNRRQGSPPSLSPPRSAAFPEAAKVRRPPRHCSRRPPSPPRSSAFPVAAKVRRRSLPQPLLRDPSCLSLHSKNDLRILQAGGGRKGFHTSSGRRGGSE